MYYKYKFSILTPCYNAEKTIHRVYDSLKSQTCRDFEWIVIDDASTDRTGEIIEKYVKEVGFTIQYLKNEKNEMKPYSVDQGIRIAQGEFLLISDSDDEFSPNTLERLLSVWQAFSENKSISGITCSCKDQYGNFIGTHFPESPWISDEMAMRYKYVYT